MKLPTRIARMLSAGIALIPMTGAVEEKSSETDPRLSKILSRFPESDADRNGVLTQKEVDQYLEKRKSAGRPRINSGESDPDSQQVTPTLANVGYGPHERQVLDFWKADAKGPAPVIIYFHGGGFVMGKKRLDSFQRLALEAGISAVSASYRYVREAPFPEPLLDGARAVQFVRSKAEEWNIDPERVVLSGHSAGGMMALWIAFHEDLAKTESEDPITRQSTRVSCVVAWSTPCTLDPEFCRTRVGGDLRNYATLEFGYGIRSAEDLKREKVRALLRETSPIEHVTPGDPPVWLGYKFPLHDGLLPADTPDNEVIHSPRFGVILQKKMKSAGLECLLNYPGSESGPKSLDFLKRQLGIE